MQMEKEMAEFCIIFIFNRNSDSALKIVPRFCSEIKLKSLTPNETKHWFCLQINDGTSFSGRLTMMLSCKISGRSFAISFSVQAQSTFPSRQAWSVWMYLRQSSQTVFRFSD